VTAALPRANAQVQAAARAAGLSISIVEHAQPTRTAEEAASACGVEVGRIVKSLVFVGRQSRTPILLLVSGANRVSESAVAAHPGEKLDRPDAQFVRDLTGFAIGGIPPFGHDTALRTFMDRDLMGFPTVWAAAGTPVSVFEITPADLQRATSATVIAVTAG
jgi:prolyl-tRNA editing enzyme YbaK/EbsC (Cys-tRNA(Pro) deacylase)